MLVAGATYAVLKVTNVKPENQEKNNPEVVADKIIEEEPEKEEVEVDLQPVLNSWASTFSHNARGVAIIDLESGKVVGELDSGGKYATASLYKLFVVYEGYRRVETGALNGDEACWGGLTVNECLDRAIRESHSGCAESLLVKMGGGAEIDRIIRDNFGLENSSVPGLSSTPMDIAKMMEYYYRHKDLSEASWAKIKDSMLNQPVSDPQNNCEGACDWRRGLPKGFSENVNVYNKVGWDYNGAYWVVYDDAAILEFPKYNRHFAIAVMTSGFPNTNKIIELGEMLEEAITAYLQYE